MKTFFYSIFLQLIAFQLAADCASQWLDTYPKSKKIYSDSQIILVGHGDTRTVIENLNTDYPIFLVSNEHYSQLEIKKINRGNGRSLTQAVLQPKEQLKIGLTYQLEIECLPPRIAARVLKRKNLNTRKYEPITWTVKMGQDKHSPRFLKIPEFEKTEFGMLGCGNISRAIFTTVWEDQSEVFAITQLKEVATAKVWEYHLPIGYKEIEVGRNMCSGAFSYDRGNYQVRFKLVDIVGNTNNRWTKWLTFESPYEKYARETFKIPTTGKLQSDAKN